MDTKVVSISLTKDIYELLIKYAKDDSRNISSFVRKLILDYDKNYGKIKETEDRVKHI